MPLTAREKMRRYRERLKTENPEKYEEQREKNLARIKSKKKKISEMVPAEAECKREEWRKEKRLSRQRCQDMKRALHESTSDCVEPCAVDELCRLCCTSNSVENDIFDSEDDLQSKMVDMRIEVRLKDGLPRRVCGSCRSNVLRLHRFCGEARRAQGRLRAMLQGTGEEEDVPITHQERGTQTECLQDSYLGQDGSDLHGPDSPLIDVKEEFLEYDEGQWEADGESDDNRPLVDIKAEKKSRKRQVNLSSPQELKSNRPDLEIDVKSEQESLAGDFTYSDGIMDEESMNIDPIGTSAPPRRKRGRPRKNEIQTESATSGKENKAKRKQAAKPSSVKTAKSEKPKIKKTAKSTSQVPVNGEGEDDSDDYGLSDWKFPKGRTGKYKSKIRMMYTCCICSQSLESREKTLEHYKDHEEQPERERGAAPPAPAPPADGRCPRCAAELAGEPWPVHWRRHWLRDRYRCALCVKAVHFENVRDIVQHGISQHAREKDAHGAVKYMCDLCPSKFVQMKKLLRHRLLKHSEEGRPRPRCARCPFVGTVSTLRLHVSRAHEFSPILCPQCGKTFRQAHHLKRHLLAIHSGEKPHKCRYCGKGFATTKYLPDHERTHTGEKPHKCAYCGRGFSQRSSRMTHERIIHTQERPFPCRLCGRSFATKGLRTSHLKTACV